MVAVTSASRLGWRRAPLHRWPSPPITTLGFRVGATRHEDVRGKTPQDGHQAQAALRVEAGGEALVEDVRAAAAMAMSAAGVKGHVRLCEFGNECPERLDVQAN